MLYHCPYFPCFNVNQCANIWNLIEFVCDENIYKNGHDYQIMVVKQIWKFGHS